MLGSTHLGGGDAFAGGVPRSELSLWSPLSRPPAEPLDATDASVDSAGSWMDAWLPCRWRCGGSEATVDVDDGREMSWPMDGSDGLSSKADAVLKAGRSKACSIDGRRNDSGACGRGRIEVASAEAVVVLGGRNAVRFSPAWAACGRRVGARKHGTAAARERLELRASAVSVGGGLVESVGKERRCKRGQFKQNECGVAGVEEAAAQR